MKQHLFFVRFFKAFSMAAIYSLFIINKSGGLIFYKVIYFNLLWDLCKIPTCFLLLFCIFKICTCVFVVRNDWMLNHIALWFQASECWHSLFFLLIFFLFPFFRNINFIKSMHFYNLQLFSILCIIGRHGKTLELDCTWIVR